MTSKINQPQTPYKPPTSINQPTEPQSGEATRELFIAKITEFNQNHHQSMKVRRKIPSKQMNTNWLYNKKRWAEKQVEKIKEIQKLQNNNNLSIKNLKRFNNTLKKANTFYDQLIKKIQTEINKSPPLLAFKEHVKPPLVGPIERLVESINECVNKIMCVLKHGWMFKKMNDLLGEYQTASAGNMIFLKTVLEAPGFKDVLGLKNSKPENHFNHLVDELTEIRERQLELILTGRRALNMLETLPSGRSIQDILSKAEGFIVALKILKPQLNENSHAQMNEIINLVSVLIENAFPRNTQAISDCLYPKCVLKSKSFKAPGPTIERSQRNKIEASKKKGHLKGFSNRNSSTLLERACWKAVKVEKDALENVVFVKGFYNISLQTPDGHEASSGAELDLSPLGHLSEAQVNKIFDLTTTLLSHKFELLGAKADQLTGKENKSRLTLLKKIKSDLSELQLDNEKVKKLYQIVVNFSYKMTSAMTLAMLTVGHKQE